MSVEHAEIHCLTHLPNLTQVVGGPAFSSPSQKVLLRISWILRMACTELKHSVENAVAILGIFSMTDHSQQESDIVSTPFRSNSKRKPNKSCLCSQDNPVLVLKIFEKKNFLLSNELRIDNIYSLVLNTCRLNV